MTQSLEASVVIPTRDRWPLLRAHAIASALAQDAIDFEVIVVDDGSSDETETGLAELEDPRLRVIRHDASKGVAAARNAGIADARGEWVAFLDDDDLWSPRKLRAHIDALDGGLWGYASAIVVDDSLRPVYALPNPDPATVMGRLMNGNVVPGGPSNVVVRADLARELGGFDESLRHHTEDWDFWIRLCRAAPPVACGEVLVATLQHGGRSALRGGWDVVREAERLLGKHGPVSRAQLLGVAEWLAFAHHRGGHRFRSAGFFLRAAITYRSPGNLAAAAGALSGDRGMRLLSRLLTRVRGGSHVELDVDPEVQEPPWLERYRATPGSPDPRR
jgi:glycosyltransferase involved in cell wall biosynthesis